MKTLAASLSILTREGVMLYLLRGVAFTCIISVLGVIMGLIVGSLLALARTYCKKGPTRILGWFATAYIELFRNTPYLLWIFICVVFCPCPGFFARKMFGLTSVEMKLLFKAALALILFNSSVIAEIVRGGLNGVSKGQFEAGYAQGFNTAEVLLYIVLPQAYRNIVPTLLSQVITTIKDSSYLANVATIELMARIRQLLSAAGTYNGLGTVNVSDVMVLFGTACVIYFIINFTLSCVCAQCRTAARRLWSLPRQRPHKLRPIPISQFPIILLSLFCQCQKRPAGIRRALLVYRGINLSVSLCSTRPGCGTQHPQRFACVLLAAAPTTTPCFRHWRRSSLLPPLGELSRLRRD